MSTKEQGAQSGVREAARPSISPSRIGLASFPPLVAFREDGAAVVITGKQAECPSCRRMALILVNVGGRTCCVHCEPTP